MSVCFQIGVPRANQDFICLLWGEAEVRVAPSGTQNKRLLYFGRAEVRVAFNDRAERYHSRNLVTERGVIGQCDLIVERDFAILRIFASKHFAILCIFA